MGDAVNLAARLEGVNKKYGTQVIVSEDTAAAAGDAFVFRELDTVRVVGRATPVRLFEPIGLRDEVAPAQVELLARFAAALAQWRRGEFAAAAESFLVLAPADPAAARFAERAAQYAANPPKAWDGVATLTEK